jgi:putative flippase GtrA
MRSPPPDELRRIALFAAVGVANTLLSLAVYRALIALQAGTLAAGAPAFAAGALNGYLLNSRFTFRARRSKRVLSRYVAVQLVAAGAADVLLWALVGAIHRPAFAFVATIAVVSTATFLVCRRFVFAVQPSVNRLRT